MVSQPVVGGLFLFLIDFSGGFDCERAGKSERRMEGAAIREEGDGGGRAERECGAVDARWSWHLWVKDHPVSWCLLYSLFVHIRRGGIALTPLHSLGKAGAGSPAFLAPS